MPACLIFLGIHAAGAIYTQQNTISTKHTAVSKLYAVCTGEDQMLHA